MFFCWNAGFFVDDGLMPRNGLVIVGDDGRPVFPSEGKSDDCSVVMWAVENLVGLVFAD